MTSSPRAKLYLLLTALLTAVFIWPIWSGVAQERRSFGDIPESRELSSNAVERFRLVQDGVKPRPPRVCRMMGCGESFAMTLRSPKWIEGTYDLQFLNDKNEMVCEIAFVQPALSLFRDEQPSKRCGMRLLVSDSTRQDATTVRIAARHKPGPELIRLRVILGGQTLFEAPVQFQSRKHAPNGPGCEPVCNRYSLEISVEMPATDLGRIGLTDAQIAQMLIARSRAEFRAKGHTCGCPGERKPDGKPCLSRDYAPLSVRPFCRISDVSRSEVEDYRGRFVR